MTAFAEQVVALLDHLGAPAGRHRRYVAGRQRLARGGRLAPERVRGLIIEMPVLDNARRGRDPGLRAADVRGPVPAVDRRRPARGDPSDPARRSCRSGPASCSTPSTSAPTRSRRSCTGCSSAGSPRRRERRRAHHRAARWWSATPRTRSTRPPTPRCWPRRCPTRRSSGPGASWSGGSGPSGSTTRPPSSPSTVLDRRPDAPAPRRS